MNARFAVAVAAAWVLGEWAGAAARGQTAAPLASVRSVSIGAMGESRDAKEVARQLAAEIHRGKTLQIANAGQADAQLEGQAAIWIRGYHSLSPRARTNDAYAEPVFGGYLSVTLKQKDGEVLWSYFAQAKNTGSRSDVGRELADQVLRALADAMRQASATTSTAVAATGARAATLRGGGATFPFPIYQRWLTSFLKADPATAIHYDPIGSTAGVARFSAGEFDFAGSDVPLPALKTSRPALALPTVAGGVVMVYHLPKFSGELRLTPEAIAGIFQGKIARWNDAALRALNPGSPLPDQPIRVVHRSDGSGTTFALAHYLTVTVGEWRETLGEADRLRWPVGEGVEGNDRVAEFIENTPYGFGYTEFIFAFRRELSIASIRGATGRFLQPDLPGIAAAAACVKDSIPGDFHLSLANTPCREAYPIASLTWLVVPRAAEGDPDKRAALKRFLVWVLGPGQSQAMGLGYAPLPKALLDEELKAVAAWN